MKSRLAKLGGANAKRMSISYGNNKLSYILIIVVKMSLKKLNKGGELR